MSNPSGLACKTCFDIQVIKPHIPLIKFRKGHVDSCHTTQIPQQSSQGVIDAKPAKSTSYSLEEYQLPTRFRRLPLDSYEIEAINSGGLM